MDPMKWPVTTTAEVAACYDASVAEVYRYAARLAGRRAGAEDLVSDAYMSLVRAAREGAVESVSVGWLITVVRRRHMDRLRSRSREKRRLQLVASTPEDATAPSASNSIVRCRPTTLWGPG